MSARARSDNSYGIEFLIIRKNDTFWIDPTSLNVTFPQRSTLALQNRTFPKNVQNQCPKRGPRGGRYEWLMRVYNDIFLDPLKFSLQTVEALRICAQRVFLLDEK